MKANRISDDSGVEVNMTDQSCGSESIMSSISSSISSLFNYKYSVNSNPESRLSHPSPQPPEVVCEKKLSHVQLMRMRFENMCKFTSNEEQRPKCEPGCNSNNIIAEQQPAPVVIEGKPVTIDDESEGDKTTTSSQNACDCDNVNTSGENRCDYRLRQLIVVNQLRNLLTIDLCRICNGILQGLRLLGSS